MSATKMVSSSQYPILSASIPIYDWLMDRLEKFRNQAGVSDEIRNAIKKGLDKIKQYYERSDESSLYPVATSK